MSKYGLSKKYSYLPEMNSIDGKLTYFRTDSDSHIIVTSFLCQFNYSIIMFDIFLVQWCWIWKRGQIWYIWKRPWIHGPKRVKLKKSRSSSGNRPDQDQEKFQNLGPDRTRSNKVLKISDRTGRSPDLPIHGPWIHGIKTIKTGGRYSGIFPKIENSIQL